MQCRLKSDGYGKQGLLLKKFLGDLTRVIESETEDLVAKLAWEIEQVARLIAAIGVPVSGLVLHSVEEDGFEPQVLLAADSLLEGWRR